MFLAGGGFIALGERKTFPNRSGGSRSTLNLEGCKPTFSPLIGRKPQHLIDFLSCVSFSPLCTFMSSPSYACLTLVILFLLYLFFGLASNIWMAPLLAVTLRKKRILDLDTYAVYVGYESLIQGPEAWVSLCFATWLHLSLILYFLHDMQVETSLGCITLTTETLLRTSLHCI